MTMLRTLPAIIHKDEYTALVEFRLLDFFREAIFGPLLQILEDAGIRPKRSDQRIGRTPEVVMNRAKDALTEAIRTGRIVYQDGRFTGSFSAAISRQLRALGAVFTPASGGSFALDADLFTGAVQGAVLAAQQAAEVVHADILRTLTAMADTITRAPTGLQLAPAIDKISADLHRQFERSTDALDAISIPAEVTPEMRASITRNLTENLDLDIKGFAAEEIPQLRLLVERSAFAGGRADLLSRIIEARYGIAKRKAKFLAGQETSLVVSRYRQERYESIGSRQYRWSTSHDDLVRPAHAALNGRVFDWDSPPIVDPAVGRRCNPGEDFNCRCVALPIVPVQAGVFAEAS